MTKRIVLSALALLVATPAFAEEEKKAKNREEAWEVGVRVNGFTADPFLTYFYDETMPVQGFTGSAFLTRHSAGGNRVIIGAAYSQAKVDDGLWLEKGGTVDAREWTEIRNMNILEAHVIIGKEWSFGPFGFFTGAGLGVAVPQGTITSYRTLPPNFTDEDPTDPGDPKDIPPAVPTVILRVGPTIHLGPMMTLYADVGLHNGLYGGAALGLKF